MNQLNQILVEGNIVKDCEVGETLHGLKIVKFSIGVNYIYKNDNAETVNEVSYFDIEMYGHMAEVFADKCKKDREVRVVGRLKQERWKDSDGKLCSKLFIVAEHVELKPLLKGEDEQL